jgi:predicted dehydrogenase/sugar phosphate isomerase/epimerase
MPPLLSFVTANFVARQLGYRMEKGWQQGDAATKAWFSPLQTFPERFEAMLIEIKALGFTAIDLWSAHLHWQWATLQHVETARGLLLTHGLTVRSYAAWVPGDVTDLQGACRLCAALDIPIIVGHIQLFAENRSAAVSILREHGIAYAIENHPEKGAAEVWKRLGEGDEDLVGVALDTGWCATQGWDALAAVSELEPRIKVVHLKDVRARREEKTGFDFIDMGHETCRLGDGVVPIKAILSVLKARGFRGPLGIEHEPELFDPSADVKESREQVSSWWDSIEMKEISPPLRVAVVGCGNIADGYGEAMRTRREIEILGASDIDPTRAQAWVAKYGGRAYISLDDVLADPAVEAVVNLTIQHAHVEVVTRCLMAGKHVHTEKPLAPTFTEASKLVALADSLGLRLSCAPVAWLGESQQTAWKLIREGRIGTPRVAYVTVDWGRIEAWHPNPAPFYAVGPVFDVAVYSLTMLTAWFGPARRVIAGGGILLPDRKTKDGVPFKLATDDFAVAVLDFAGGVKARLTANFYVGEPAENRAGFEIHGDAGSISTAWFAATAKIRIGPFGGKYHRVPPVRPPVGVGEWYCDWSAGVFELWRALRTDRPHPTGGEHAAHVVEVMESVHRSIKEGRAIEVTSKFSPPEPLEWAK